MTTSTAESVATFIDEYNTQYLALHRAYEDNFWSTKMSLADASAEALTSTKQEYDAFLRDKTRLAAVREQMASGAATEAQLKVLRIMAKTFECYIMESAEAERIADELTALEAALQSHRNTMALGYVHPDTGELVKGSSVLLRTTMRTHDDERHRRACYDAMRGIGEFVAEKFVDIVKGRNRMAKMLGFVDYYDYKVTQAEGFGKETLFTILDGLEKDTRPLSDAARAALAADKGADALLPWNTGYCLAGETDKLQDPYFPFEKAPGVWAASFAALGINYQQSTMNLDLCDRQGKYSNGFCHWPIAPYTKSDGTWVPAQTNFTSLATPSAVGSGSTALTTLMHEGGHAAHFANITQGSPFFSQERAPTSVAYAENQSMFLDSLCDDAAWLGRYAKSRNGEVMPFELMEQAILAKFPYKVAELRSMIAVPYFEKALYEMPEEQLTAASLMALADQVEKDIQGGPSGRPLLSVPHILSDESSCYYHGYVLAEMSVHQTRKYFLDKYSNIVDNPEVGKELTAVYWQPGNGEAFLDLVEKLTGKPLTGDAWVDMLKVSVPDKIAAEKEAYAAAVKAGPAQVALTSLGMRARFVHGDAVIADSQTDGSFEQACDKFEQWVHKEFLATAAA